MPKYLQMPNERHVIVMASAPLNSSGDIYHIIAYVLLALKRGNDVPKILLGRDKASHAPKHVVLSNINTGDQVERSLFLARSLGLGAHFDAIDIESGSSAQPSVRQKRLENALIATDHKHYIDHRIATSIIAKEILDSDLPEITRILRAGFVTMDPVFLNNETTQSVINYAKNQKKLLGAKVRSAGLVLIHYRYSANANSEQAMEKYAQNIIDYLISKELCVAVLYVDPRKKIQKSGILNNTVFDIRPFQNGNIIENTDIAKLRHIHTLKELLSLESLKGIVGNTSGTLDLAAFLGHRVFNIHDFSVGSTEVADRINHQNYRLLIQITFLTIQARSEHDDSNNGTMLLNLWRWISNQQQLSKKNAAMKRPNLSDGTDASAHNGFSYFSSMKKLVRDSSTRGSWNSLSFFSSLQQQTEKTLEDTGFITPNNVT